MREGLIRAARHTGRHTHVNPRLIALLVAVATPACSSAGAGPPVAGPNVPKKEKAPSMTSAPPTDVKTLLSLASLSRREVEEKLQPVKVVDNVAYEKLKGLTRIGNPAVHPAWFFLRGDQLVMVYIGNQTFLSQLKPDAVAKELGGPGKELPSRVAKSATQHVYADKGFAFSEEDGALAFVEIFPPMPHERYLETVYETVTPFTK